MSAAPATYGAGTEDMAEIEERSPEGGFTDRGVSIHVCATDGGHEFLRFGRADSSDTITFIQFGSTPAQLKS